MESRVGEGVKKYPATQILFSIGNGLQFLLMAVSGTVAGGIAGCQNPTKITGR